MQILEHSQSYSFVVWHRSIHPFRCPFHSFHSIHSLNPLVAILILISIGFFFLPLPVASMLLIFLIFYKLITDQNVWDQQVTSTNNSYSVFLNWGYLEDGIFPLHFWMMKLTKPTAAISFLYVAAISSLLGIYMIMRFLYFTIEVNLVYIPFPYYYELWQLRP